MFLNLSKLLLIAAMARLARAENVTSMYAYEKIACLHESDCGAAHRWIVRPKDGRAVGIAVRAVMFDVGTSDCASGRVSVYNASLDANSEPVCNVTGVRPSIVWCGRLDAQTVGVEFAGGGGDKAAITVDLCGDKRASLYLKFKQIHGGACGELETGDHVDFHGAVPTWDNPTGRWRYPVGTTATRYCLYGHGVAGNATQRTAEAVCGDSGKWDADYAEGTCERIVSPIGGPCDEFEACTVPTRCNDTVCDCVKPHYLAESLDVCEAPLGANCELDTAYIVCAPGTACDNGTLTCGCEAPNVVHPVDGDTCVTIVRPGGACNGTGTLCANGTSCGASAVCQCDAPTVLEGEQCVQPPTTTRAPGAKARCYRCAGVRLPSALSTNASASPPCNATVDCEGHCYAEFESGRQPKTVAFGCASAGANCTAEQDCCLADLCNTMSAALSALRPSDARLYPLYAVATGLLLLLLAAIVCGNLAFGWAARRGGDEKEAKH